MDPHGCCIVFNPMGRSSTAAGTWARRARAHRHRTISRSDRGHLRGHGSRNLLNLGKIKCPLFLPPVRTCFVMPDGDEVQKASPSRRWWRWRLERAPFQSDPVALCSTSAVVTVSSSSAGDAAKARARKASASARAQRYVFGRRRRSSRSCVPPRPAAAWAGTMPSDTWTGRV